MKKKNLNALRLNKSLISNLHSMKIKGGLVTTDQSTVVETNYCDTDSCTSDPRDATISHSNCGNCGSWAPTC